MARQTQLTKPKNAKSSASKAKSSASKENLRPVSLPHARGTLTEASSHNTLQDDKVAALRAENAKQKAEIEVLTQANSRLSDKTPKILPRPHNRKNLQKAMGLKNRRLYYLRIRAIVRQACYRAKVPMDVLYKEQDMTTLSNVQRLVCKKEPYLLRYQNCWPVSEVIKTVLANYRQHQARVAAGLSEDEALADHLDAEEDDNDNDNDEVEVNATRGITPEAMRGRGTGRTNRKGVKESSTEGSSSEGEGVEKGSGQKGRGRTHIQENSEESESSGDEVIVLSMPVQQKAKGRKGAHVEEDENTVGDKGASRKGPMRGRGRKTTGQKDTHIEERDGNTAEDEGTSRKGPTRGRGRKATGQKDIHIEERDDNTAEDEGASRKGPTRGRGRKATGQKRPYDDDTAGDEGTSRYKKKAKVAVEGERRSERSKNATKSK